MKKLFSLITLLTLLLGSFISYADEVVTNNEKVAKHLNDRFYYLNKSQNDYQEVEIIARRKKKRKTIEAEFIRNTAYEEIERDEAKPKSLRETSQNWSTKERIIAMGKAYASASSIERIGRVTWKDLERHASPEDLENIANHVRIQYLWLRNVIKAYYDKVKGKRYLGMPLESAIILAKADLKFITKFKKQAEDSRNWILSNPEGGLWEALCQAVVDTAEEALDYNIENLAYLEKVKEDTSPETIAAKSKVKKEAADSMMYKAMDEAATIFIDDIEYVRNRMYNQLFKVNSIVEDTPDASWINKYASFNYNMPCSLEDTIAVAVVIKGYKQEDIIELNDKGYYKDELSVEAVYPELLGLCAAITVPNSGVNIHSSKENGTLHAYRHWWRVEITETEEEQIAAVIEQLRTLKDKINKPVFLTLSNDKERAGVTKVISRLTELNEIGLISGTIVINSETAKFKAFNIDGDEVYRSSEPTTTEP
ncbi:secreted protein [methanotrophic bacterial endosymbiont of Bathymodiolus sp.]|nr:secreted protein [methanotrophic bacterial endosymbiont of Bathymodiolus sp.]